MNELVSLSVDVAKRMEAWLAKRGIRLPTASGHSTRKYKIDALDYLLWLDIGNKMEIDKEDKEYNYIHNMSIEDLAKRIQLFDTAVRKIIGHQAYRYYFQAARLDAKLLYDLKINKETDAGGINLTTICKK